MTASPLPVRVRVPQRLLIGLALGFSLMAPAPLRAADPPFGLEKRVPWTTSRLIGSPEPPLPYTVEKTFTKQTFKSPIYIADEPGTQNLWVIQADEKATGARLVRIPDDPQASSSETLLEIPNSLTYSVCFHPRYAENGYVYIFTNGPRDVEQRSNRVVRYTVERTGSRKPLPDSALTIIEWKSGGHDGGDMTFGLDGFLYITTGDGTSDSDTWNSGQTLDDLLGSVLRIDVDHPTADRPYAIPADNPFLSTPGARPEIWAYGLRNPWRMSSDAKTGHIWVGNNGQDLWETAYLIERGANYGWSVYEGSHPFYLERKRGPTPLVPPTIEHPHSEFRSLTGGVVYHGTKYPDLDGAYLYGDYSTGRIWAMKHDGTKPLFHREIADTTLSLAAFRVDQQGDILIADYATGIYKLVPAPKVEQPAPFPKMLSETGLFSSTRDHQIAPGVIPYSVIAPGWNDGATANRFLAVPGDAKVGFNETGPWTLPDGTAIVQTLSTGPADNSSRIETRVLLRQQGEWAGYTYRWSADQSDATLVPREGADIQIDLAEDKQSWRLPSRSECMACHSRAANFVLGLSGQQLNRDHDYGPIVDNQLRALDHIGLFETALTKPPAELARIADPYGNSSDLEARVRSYLHVNCSVCHVEAGGGNAQMQLALGTAREKTGLISARPQHDTFALANAMIVAPGAPDRSVLLHRISTTGRGQMPPLVRHQVDQRAADLIRDWIASLPPDRPFVRAWTLDELAPRLANLKPDQPIDSGRKLFLDVGCAQCHKFEGQGGSVGPDLQGITKRLAPHLLLESLVDPSKAIADEYATHIVATEDGAIHSGRIEREDEQVLVLRPPSPADLVTIPKSEIAERRRSEQSNMPAGILNTLQADEILDLLAYLLRDPQPRSTESK